MGRSHRHPSPVASHGKGPCFIQIGRLIRYLVAEVESFERQMKTERSWNKRIPVAAFMEVPSKKIGRLRRSKFSEKKSQAIIQTYLTHLSECQPVRLSACLLPAKSY